MEFQKIIEDRRSIRKFDSNKEVSEDQVKEIVNGARLAPSWKNSQAWRYYAIMDENKCKDFRKNCLLSSNPENSKGAKLIVTTFKRNRSGFDKTTGQAENNGGNGWGYYDLALSNCIFILKAKDLGLDTLIMGIRDEEKIKEFLDLPEDEEEVVSVIALGYRDENPDPRPRKEVDQILTII